MNRPADRMATVDGHLSEATDFLSEASTIAAIMEDLGASPAPVVADGIAWLAGRMQQAIGSARHEIAEARAIAR